tara:strand:+ start:601 stop:834 length:234 start_codon:yes stop_codon:yes gene_type:complete
MPKKSKKNKKARQRRSAPTTAFPTQQQQFIAIHNQSLKNSQRDNAQAQRIAQSEEKEFKLDTLKLQRVLIEKKLSLL